MKSVLAAFVILLCTCMCNKPHHRVSISEEDLAPIWADMTLYITRYTPANSPTFASRALGYIGLTMYESVVHSSPVHRSLGGQLNSLPPLPVPEKNKSYIWPLSLNAAQASILKSIYIQTSQENKRKIDSLEHIIYDYYLDSLQDKEAAERSAAYGRKIAGIIFEWSKTDLGHRGYLSNFDSKMQYPSGSGFWKPPFYAQQITRLPLHPHWGDNRTFLTADTNWAMPNFINHDAQNSSDSYKQFNEVYVSNKNISPEQKEIAIWWNDDPSETFTPPGHSYNLGSTIVRLKKPGLVKSAETYARIGIATADAFIVCWRIKYHFFSERPSTYVQENIDDEWSPFWPDPPFPAFPSGHATQAAAVATVMQGLYGDAVHFTDSTHTGRPKDQLRNASYKSRTFDSFWAVAEETAYSRFLGGIHTAQDNKVGLNEGKKIGQNINALEWSN